MLGCAHDAAVLAEEGLEIRRAVVACSEVHLASSRNVLRLNRSNARFEWRPRIGGVGACETYAGT
jgi:hypothetical protein